MGCWWNDIDKGKLKYLEKKTCSSATLSTTNPTLISLGLKLNRCDEERLMCRRCKVSHPREKCKVNAMHS